MAGDWIKMRGNLWDDPRVSKLCDLTECGEAQIVGGLYWLWATADQHTEDGVMPGLSMRQIDRKTGVAGLGVALCDIGWLADHPEGIRIVNFEDHNGSSAKKRCQTAKRVANHKTGNAEVTHGALPETPVSVSDALPREEKRREELKELPHTPQAGPSRAIALQTYLANCKAEGKKAVAEDSSVFTYADEVGISQDLLRLQWLEFKDRYSLPDARKYKDWSNVFGKSVRGNWFKLWYAKDGGYQLTTTGQQAQALHKGKA